MPTPSGRLILTAKRFVAPDPDGLLAALGDNTTIVCLNPERELMEWADYPRWLRQHQPAHAWWFSMPDWQAPPLDEMDIVFDEVIERLRRDETVVVHCSHGQGRTGTVAVGVLMLMEVPRAEAERTVASHRPGAGPAAGSQTSVINQLEARLAQH